MPGVNLDLFCCDQICTSFSATCRLFQMKSLHYVQNVGSVSKAIELSALTSSLHTLKNGHINVTNVNDSLNFKRTSIHIAVLYIRMVKCL